MSVSIFEMVILCMMMSLMRRSSDCHLARAVLVKYTPPVLIWYFLKYKNHDRISHSNTHEPTLLKWNAHYLVTLGAVAPAVCGLIGAVRGEDSCKGSGKLILRLTLPDAGRTWRLRAVIWFKEAGKNNLSIVLYVLQCEWLKAEIKIMLPFIYPHVAPNP